MEAKKYIGSIFILIACLFLIIGISFPGLGNFPLGAGVVTSIGGLIAFILFYKD